MAAAPNHLVACKVDNEFAFGLRLAQNIQGWEHLPQLRMRLINIHIALQIQPELRGGARHLGQT